MPSQLTAPGVYVEEIPSGSRAIAGVATSITAFIGRARRGPTDRPTALSSFADFERTYGALHRELELGYALRQFFLNGGSTAVVVRVVNPTDGTPAAAATRSLPATSGADLVLEARSEGAWGASLRATVHYDTGAPIGEAAVDAFHLTLDEVDPDAPGSTPYEDTVLRREVFRDLSVDPLATRFVGSVLEAQSRLARVRSQGPNRPSEASRQAFTGGEDGPAPTSAQVEAAVDLLDLADVVNLIAIPPYDANPVHADVYTKALAWAEDNRAVLLVDPDDDWVDATSAASLGSNYGSLRSPNSAFFFPRIQAPDPLRDHLVRTFPPSAAVAGVMSRTDASRGVWKAPAGLEATLRDAAGLTHTMTDDRVGIVNARGVNALRTLPVVGEVVWGSRTGVGADTLASEWKYLSVRRTALFIEESLSRGLQWAVFEPNDEPLWAQIRLSVGNFMDGLFRQGAFQGSTPREAYLVRCDATTTTPDDVGRGVVNIVVGFAGLKPAEFVVLHFTQIAGQSGT